MSQHTSQTPLLLETIKIEDGVICNITYHQERCNQSRKTIYDVSDILDLTTHIIAPTKGLYRCRILYGIKVHSVEYIPYTPKIISSLKILSSDIDYTHKYANRNALESLLNSEKNYDDILIEKEGYLTDISIANIAFYDGKQWITPHKPLLKGTMRQKLIDEGFLHPEQIKVADIPRYSQVALINAMIGFKILKNIRITDNKGNHYDY